jgi:hypothetical protein
MCKYIFRPTTSFNYPGPFRVNGAPDFRYKTNKQYHERIRYLMTNLDVNNPPDFNSEEEETIWIQNHPSYRGGKIEFYNGYVVPCYCYYGLYLDNCQCW